MQLALVALFALVLAPTLCDAQAVRRASPEEPSGRKRGRPGGPSHQVQRPSKYEHNDEPGHKPNNGGVCEPMKTCYTDHECAAEFPCTKTECVLEPHHLFKLGYKNAVPSGMGVCVCFENKPVETPCIGDDETVCQGPLGKCDDAGVCIPQKNDDGCPCADTDCTPPENACVDPDFKCICENGACVVNYLPAGVSCDPSTGTAVGVCEEAICVQQAALVRGTPDEVVCKVENKPMDTPCMGDENDVCQGPLGKCDDAGVCDPQPAEDGCPCTDTDCNPPADDFCVDQDFKCICKSGACVVNYLPPGGPCIPSTGTEAGVCEQAICVLKAPLDGGTPDEVECKVQDRPDNTACFLGEIVGSEPTCANAGVCKAGECDDLFCKVEPAEECKAKFPGQEVGCTTKDCGTGTASCDQACSDATDGAAACIGTDPLSCSCSSPGDGQNQFNCELVGGGSPVGEGKSRCCVCDTPGVSA